MKNKVAKIITLTIMALSLGMLSAPVSASSICDQCSKGDGSVPKEVCAANGCSSDIELDSFEGTLTTILNAIIGVAGVVAVIFIVIGGINYMTSAGDSSKVEKGKKTIIYALIGLVICALAFAIVNWVIIGVLKNG